MQVGTCCIPQLFGLLGIDKALKEKATWAPQGSMAKGFITGGTESAFGGSDEVLEDETLRNPPIVETRSALRAVHEQLGSSAGPLLCGVPRTPDQDERVVQYRAAILALYPNESGDPGREG